MKLAVLAADPDGPVVRHRVRALGASLAAAGFDEVEVHAIPKRLHARVATFRACAGADVVLLLRKLFTVAELRWLRGNAKRLVFDVDDAVMFRDPFRGKARSLVRARRFRAAVRAADRITAGNPYLVEQALAADPTCDVVLAPTPIDTQRFVPGEHRPVGLRVGWIGSRSTRAYLQTIRSALATFVGGRDGATICVMADHPPELGVDIEFTPWSESAEVPFLQSLDVGLMPLTDDPWSRGKCGFKLLQYMACGVPSIASPVGVNVDIADGGGAALLATSDDEWGAALDRLLDDPAFAADLAQRARERVVGRWSADVLGPQFAAALQP